MRNTEHLQGLTILLALSLSSPAFCASKAPPKSNSAYGVSGEIEAGPTDLGGGIAGQILCQTGSCPDGSNVYHYVYVYQFNLPSSSFEVLVSGIQGNNLQGSGLGSFYCDPDNPQNAVLCTPVGPTDTGLNAITVTPDGADSVVFSVPKNTPGCSPASPYTGQNTAVTETGCVTLFVEEDLPLSTPPPAPMLSFVRSDFNGDAHVDVVWQDPVTLGSQVFYMAGPLGNMFESAAWFTTKNTWRIAAIADFNGDGHPDLLWQDPNSGEAQVWFMGGGQGTTILSTAVLSGPNPWHVVATGDFNRDGYQDVVWQDPVSGHVQIWYLGGLQGITLLNAANVTATNTWQVVGAGDFNADGYPDLVWQDPVRGATQIWYLGGTLGNVLESAAVLTASNSWKIVAIADFNLDGHPDVVWESQTNGASQIWYLNGAQGITVTTSESFLGPNPWRIVGPR